MQAGGGNPPPALDKPLGLCYPCNSNDKGEFMKEPKWTPKVIATLQNDFGSKFGLPRQSGLLQGVPAKIVPTPEYRVPEAFRGIEDYSHLWLLWGFSEAIREDGRWSPTVRPPRLGGNRRMGVFATRSPFRPNPIGLSSVRLLSVEKDENGLYLLVDGADLMDGTPIYDIKPYLSFTDSHPDARNGFAETTGGDRLRASYPEALRGILPPEKEEALLGILRSDPRPSYQDEPGRIYGFPFAGCEVRFRVEGDEAFLLELLRLTD